MAWSPPQLSLLTKIDSSNTLIGLFTSLIRELQRMQNEIDELKKKVTK